MLDKLQQRKIYQNVYCSRVGGGHRVEAVPDKHYDVATICGGFAQAHLPVDSLREVTRMLKPGGLFLNVMTEYYLESIESLHELEPLMEKMVEEGVWTQLTRKSFPNNIGGKQGVLHIFRKN